MLVGRDLRYHAEPQGESGFDVPTDATDTELFDIFREHDPDPEKPIHLSGIGRFQALPKAESDGRAAGKVALVTGAAQGIGLGLAQELARQGARVILADQNVELARLEAGRLAERYGEHRAISVGLDVTNEESVLDAVIAAVRAYGGFDVLVSNAGILKADGVLDLPVEDFDAVTQVNYRGYYLCVRATTPILARQHLAARDRWFDIVQINSKSGLEGSQKNFAYAGGKFGGIGLTQSFALELVERGIKVNAICPGNVFDGPLWSDPDDGLFVQYLKAGKVPNAKTVEDVRKAYEAKVPMRRGCRVGDIAKALYYILEQEYETGQALPVTGGQVMLP
jgi:sorbitol-6-phosphate 2-dehydrogenase